MSIVIVGGHDRMVGQYKKNLQIFINANVKYLHRWKPTSEKKIGCPDLLVLLQILYPIRW